MRPTDPNTRVLPNGDKVLYSTFCLKVLLVPRRSSCGDFKLNFNKMVYWPQALPSKIRSQRKIQSIFSQVSLSITKTLFFLQKWKFNWNLSLVTIPFPRNCVLIKKISLILHFGKPLQSIWSGLSHFIFHGIVKPKKQINRIFQKMQ